jgi:HSP20 family protein
MLRTLVNLNPSSEYRSIEELFDRMFGTPTRPTPGATTLPIDVTENEGALIVKAAVPGVEPGELNVTIENNVLTIRGETRHESNGENEKVYRREVSYGAFARSIRLPENLNLEAVDAEFKNGLVTIKLPRQPEEKPKALKINVRGGEPTQTEQTQPENN